MAKADVPEVEDVKVDDFVLVTMSGKNKGSLSVNDLEVVSIDDVEILTNSTLTKFSNDSDSPNSDSAGQENIFTSVTTGGVEYKNSSRAFYSDDVLELYNNERLTDKAYNVYLDKYGYAIGVDLYSGGDNYVFITGVKLNSSTISSTYADANAIFLDGSMETIQVDVKETNKSIDAVTTNANAPVGKAYFKEWNGTNYSDDIAWATMNRWFTYTVDSNGVYTLTPAARMFTTDVTAEKTIKCNNVVLDLTNKDSNDNSPHYTLGTNVRAYGNDNSIYIIPEMGEVGSIASKKVITGVDGVYTGVQNVEIAVDTHTAGTEITTSGGDATAMFDSVYTVYDKNNYIIASIVIGEAKGTSANYAYILSNTKSERVEDGTYYWEFDAVVDGTKTTLTAQSKFKSTMNKLRVGHIQELRYTGSYVTAIKDVTVSADPSKDKVYTDVTAKINEQVHEIYDIGHVANAYECKNGSGCTLVNTPNAGEKRLGIAIDGSVIQAPDLHLEGSTLKLGAGADYGLTFVNVDVPTVVIHPVDGSKKTVQCGSVPEALSILGDADGQAGDGKLGFAGRLVAVLDSTGRAKWIVIISDTNTESVGAGLTGKQCTITVRYYVSEDGGKGKVAEEVLTMSTTALVNKEWTITANRPANIPAIGYHLIGNVSTMKVPYVTGETKYEAEFTYVKDAAVPYTVTFSLNGGSGTGDNPATEGSAGAGVPLLTSVTKNNYVFVGWATTAEKAAAGDADAAPAGTQRYRPQSDCTLYAVWRLPKVSFNANGGTGTIEAKSPDTAGGNVTAPDGTGLTRAGYTFSKWHTNAAGTGGTDYNANTTNVPGTADLTLYAVWTKNTVSGTIEKNAGSTKDFTVTSGSPINNAEGGGTISVTLTSSAGDFGDGAVTVTNNKNLTITGAPEKSGSNSTLTFTLTLPDQEDIATTISDLVISISIDA